MIESVVFYNFECSIESKVADKYRESTNHHTFLVAEQSEAPIESGLQRLLARRGCSRAEPP